LRPQRSLKDIHRSSEFFHAALSEFKAEDITSKDSIERASNQFKRYILQRQNRICSRPSVRMKGLSQKI
jgi:hypothetical protein